MARLIAASTGPQSHVIEHIKKSDWGTFSSDRHHNLDKIKDGALNALEHVEMFPPS